MPPRGLKASALRKARRARGLCDTSRGAPEAEDGVSRRGIAGHPRASMPRVPKGSLASTRRGLPSAAAHGLEEGRAEARAGPHGTCYTSLPAVGEHRGSPRPERYRLGKLSSSTGPFGAGVSPPPALCFSPLETQGVSRAPAGGQAVGRAGGSGQSVSSGNAKAPPRLRPCSKCSRGSGAASPELCTRGARSPR